MADWHSSCAETDCRRRCQRPGCLRPDDHLLTTYDGVLRGRLHLIDCRIAFDRSQLPASAPPRRPAAPLLPPGPSPLHPAMARAGFRPEQDAWDDPLTRRAAIRYLAVHLERTLSYIAHRVIRNDFRPAPIAATLAAQDLVCSRATWKRDVTTLEALGLIAREVRAGRPKGGGKNAGSLYQVHWGRIPQAWPRKFKPAHLGGNGQFETGSLRDEIGSLLGQAVLGNGSSAAETGAKTATGNWLKMERNRPNGRDDARPPGRHITDDAATAANGPGIPHPQPPPQGGGNAQQGKGDPLPASVAAQVHQADWYRRPHR
jgi:hypothetical protein